MRIKSTLLLSVFLVSGCVTDGGSSRYSESWSQYDHNRPDPSYNGYEAERYYRKGNSRQEQRLSHNDRIYRGRDGQYYCRREDGSTGLIIGAIAGGGLGNVIAPGGSELLGTLLGAGGGALAGRAIDRNVRCR